MQVIEVERAGGPEVLRLAERVQPVPEPDEVLIRVRAAGMNHADLAQRAGLYPLPPGTTDILGLEVAGEVVQVGKDVVSLKEGDAVCALLAGGGYAEYVAAPAVQCLPMPSGMTFAQAAVLPEAFATVWLNVFDKASLKRGERLLVHGGSSGVGIAAIQLATAWGAEVYCTAGTDEKCRRCEEEGATRAINYRSEDFEEVLTGGSVRKHVDVVFDMIGGSYFPKNIKVLARDGRMVYVSALAGRKVELDLVDLMRKRLSLFGSVLRPLSPAAKGSVLRGMSEVVWPLLEEKRFVPVIHQQFPFDRVVDAHALMQSHGHIGKLALTW
ncbi:MULTISPECIES: NAD(P)H-quinone oxidoreductase [unclassified Variovorax]|uniref:NAD(P)H-quinone oxidoreductase n=1 Tax=unclassified Variovorax TaxID=663243 RepID=UPI001BD3FC43|nr:MULTISPECIES: NAD(P)H-quinone oxidoreductase [unclassified Variovorax]